MRKVVLYTLMSLDGVAESPDAFVFDFDGPMTDNLAAVIGRQDTVLLGRRMYDEWAAYWPTSDVQPFADFINTVQKYVFTSTPVDATWAATSVVTTDAAAFVRDLKSRPGGDIGVHGSIRLARSLLSAGVINRLSLVVCPALAGRGRRLFEDDRTLQRLSLADVTPTPSGSLLLDYEVDHA